MEWTDTFEVTPKGRRLLNRAKDAIAAAAAEPLDERPELILPVGTTVPTEPPTDCRQCNESSSLYVIASAISDYMQARREERL